MLAHRIIPTLLCRGRALVKGQQFDSWRSCGVVQQAMKIHQVRGVDEVLLLDIDATKESRGPDLQMVRGITTGNFFPLTVGGGVKGAEDVRSLLRAGADKVAIGHAVYENPAAVEALAKEFGSSTISVIINVKGGQVWSPGCKGKGDPVIFAGLLEMWGAGEVILQSVGRDGMLTGYDLEMINAVSQVRIPVVASGGCGVYDDMHEALDAGADAVAAGAMFQFTDATPKGAAQFLHGKGWEVRL